MDNRRNLIEKIINSIYAIRHKIAVEMHFSVNGMQVTHSQLFVLHLVKKHKNISIKNLADLLEITSSAVTQIVDGLVNNGLLMRKRNPNDRRTSKIELSEKFKNQFDSIKNKSFKTVLSLFNALDNDELSKYCELNDKIAGKILLRSTRKKEN